MEGFLGKAATMALAFIIEFPEDDCVHFYHPTFPFGKPVSVYMCDGYEYEAELEELESDIIKRSKMRRSNILKKISYNDNYIHQANNIINILKRNRYIKPYVNDILNGNYNKQLL